LHNRLVTVVLSDVIIVCISVWLSSYLLILMSLLLLVKRLELIVWQSLYFSCCDRTILWDLTMHLYVWCQRLINDALDVFYVTVLCS